MSDHTASRHYTIPDPTPIVQAIIAMAVGFAVFVVLLGVAVLGYNLYYAGQIFPGVVVAGVDLSGLRPEQAKVLLAQRLTFPDQGRIAFQEGEQVWIARPREVGLFLDPHATATVAYSLGRAGDPLSRLSDQFQAWYAGKNLSPLLIYDQRIARDYIEQIAALVNLPTLEASISVNGTDVKVIPGQVGRSVDIQSTLLPLEGQLRSLSDGMLPVVVKQSPPVILDASAQAEIARLILSAPLILTVPDATEGDPGPWTFEPASLAQMLSIERQQTAEGAQYQVGLDTQQMRAFLENLEPGFTRLPANARFIFNDETRQLEVIQPAVIGRALNIETTLETIRQKLSAGEHTVELVFDISAPQVGDDATSEQLGIREPVSVETSYFYGSSASRIQNIETAASRFHGVLVPPGATFSMAEVMGDVSLDTGYAEALIIFGNRTIKGVGGGVCQVSTTLFRTVFFGGYPVVERYSHAYRVSYYEQTASGNVNPKLAGLDATVFVPVVDFKFTNDTQNWLLMETYVNASARKLTWKFYSTSDNRRVEWETTGLQNVEEAPAPLYQENPELSKGEINQVDWEADGADVTVYRTVYQGDQIYLRDQFSTHYLPWRAVYEYGPGTKIPKQDHEE